MHVYLNLPKPGQRTALLFILLALGSLLYCAQPVVAQERISLVTGEYPPYTGYNLSEGGLSTFLIKEIFRAAQLPEPILDWQGWKRGYAATKVGRYHATFPYGPDAEWEKDFLYSDPIHIYSRAFFTRHDFPEGIEGRWDGLTLCVPQGWSTSYFDKTVQKFNVTMVRPDGMETCLRMVKNGRADLVSDDVLVMAYLMKSVFGTADALIKSEYRQEDGWHFFLLISRHWTDGEDFRKKFNTGLSTLRTSGEYERLKAQYLKENL